MLCVIKQFRLYFFAFFVALFAIVPLSTAKATILLSEDFEARSVGAINGQGGWTSSGYVANVTSTVIFEGVDVFDGKSLAIDRETQVDCPACWASVPTGYFEAMFTVPEIDQPDKNQIQFYLFDQDVGSSALVQTQNGDLQIYDNGSWVSLGYSLSENVWYQIKIEWDLPNRRYRTKITGQGDWSSWATINSSQDEVDGARFYVTANGLNGSLRNGIDNVCYSTVESECGFSAGSGDFTFSLVTPSNSSTVPEFRNWELSFSGVTSSTIDYFGVEYGFASGTFNYANDTLQFDGNAYINNGYTCVGCADSDTLQLRKNYAIQEHTRWWARPYFFNSSDLSFTYGDTVVFDYLAVASAPTSTVSAPYGQLFIQVSTTTRPYGSFLGSLLYGSSSNPWAVTCSEYDVGNDTSTDAKLSCYWFRPSTSSLDYFSSGLESMFSVFPFSVASSVLSAVSGFSSQFDYSYPEIRLPLLISSTSVPILTSSTLQDLVGLENKNLIFGIIDAFLYSALAFMMARAFRLF